MNDKMRQPANFDDDLVDEASRESFPASDPPAFSPGISHGPVESIPPRSSSGDGQHRAGVSLERSQVPSALSRCCNLQAVAPWGLFVAATVAGVAVGSLLAKSYVARR